VLRPSDDENDYDYDNDHSTVSVGDDQDSSV
jgi:hypothetical protein